MAFAVAIVILPLVLALGARVFSLLHRPSERTGAWLRFLASSRLIMAGTVAIRWAVETRKLLCTAAPDRDLCR